LKKQEIMTKRWFELLTKYNDELKVRTLGELIFGCEDKKYLKTEYGLTRYKTYGEKNRLTIVVLHGLGGNLDLFEGMAIDLAKKGFRVLSYDFYDRGCSETDRIKYPLGWFGRHPLKFTLSFHCLQLQQVLDALTDNDLILVGHSTGGAVALRYATSKKNRVKGLVLMDAVVLPPKKSLAAKIAEIPFLGDLVVKFFGASSFLQFCKQCVKDIARNRLHLEQTKNLLKKNPRFLAAMASTNRYCEGFTVSLLPEFIHFCSTAPKNNIPLTLIWGQNDSATPFSPHCQQLHSIAAKAYQSSSLYSYLPFPDTPHNVYFPDAKPNECTEAIAKLAANVLQSR